MRRAPILAAALGALCLAPAGAWAEPEQLKLARNHFEYGKYADALRLSDELLKGNLVSEGPELVEVYRIQGLSNFYLGRREEARTSFVRLLSIDPDHELDALLVPPVAIAEFERAKKDNEALLAPIRERRREISKQRKLEEEARRRLLEEEERGRRDRPAEPLFIERVERHPFFVTLLPFGIPQLERGRTRAGTLFALGQVVPLAGSVVTWLVFRSYLVDGGRIRRGEMDAASAWRTANWICAGAAAGAYAWGLIDAVRRWEPETVTRDPVSQAPALGGAKTPDRSSLFFTPVPGGGAAALSVAF